MHAEPKLRAGRTRPAAASKLIADDLRKQCLQGKLQPGARLPLREELLRQYAASATTIQQAINELVADGLLEPRGRAGTFVAAHPPQVTDVALVFPSRREDPYTWRHFYHVLATSAALWQEDRRRRFVSYCCPLIAEPTGDWQRLRDDIRNMRLSGVIHATGAIPADLVNWQEKFNVPCIFISTGPGHLPALQAVVVSYQSFFSRAIEFLAHRGRRRVAVVLSPEIYSYVPPEQLDREAARCGVEIRPVWRQLVSLAEPVCARSVTQLLLGAAGAERPEGLIVADDNLVNQAILGVHDAGIEPGTDLDVVVHANFPSVLPFAGPGITRLGFDSRAILGKAVRLIDAARKGSHAADEADVPAVFEDELLVTGK